MVSYDFVSFKERTTAPQERSLLYGLLNLICIKN